MIQMINKPDKTTSTISSTTSDKTDESDEKYETLYNNIVDYFNSKEPYCDPDFNIAQVASSLNTNITYISKSIRIKRNMNFVYFVNTYRINKVKDMINKDYHNKYTLKFIYTSAGFKHQSTFNKVFKLIEGITPSQYINAMNHENDSEAL
ncbi:helix-turn-helix domain-containing protein [Apibacter raozihei]|nr:helix-turn-helix domain-containing protein [Apibacter raozihei]